jgi:hypothetical protein
MFNQDEINLILKSMVDAVNRLGLYNEFKIINTNTCCECEGIGDDCSSGGVWIYCEIRAYHDTEFDGDCGDCKGCNFFKPKIS